jgi:hypothetical protein
MAYYKLFLVYVGYGGLYTEIQISLVSREYPREKCIHI